ncbi:MAG: hypothetical protein SVR08_17955 [Spirochaetota bacterium]|nr:hypothetical protein [Spirochaetota bacterium]
MDVNDKIDKAMKSSIIASKLKRFEQEAKDYNQDIFDYCRSHIKEYNDLENEAKEYDLDVLQYCRLKIMLGIYSSDEEKEKLLFWYNELKEN